MSRAGNDWFRQGRMRRRLIVRVRPIEQDFDDRSVSTLYFDAEFDERGRHIDGVFVPERKCLARLSARWFKRAA